MPPMIMCTLSCRISFFALVTPTSGLACSSSMITLTSAPPNLWPTWSRYIWKPSTMSRPTAANGPVTVARKPMRSSSAPAVDPAPMPSARPPASRVGPSLPSHALVIRRLPVWRASVPRSGDPGTRRVESMFRSFRIETCSRFFVDACSYRRTGVHFAGTCALFAVLARRKIAAVDRLLEKRRLVVAPELADVRVGLDDRVPQLVLVVPEHLLLLDLLDVDVLDRVAHVVHAHRPAHGVELHALHDLDELLGARELAAGLLHHLVDPFGGGVVGLRIVRRHLVVLGAIGLDERRVLRRVDRGAVHQRRDVADHLVAHRRQHELVVAGAAADHRLLVASRRELLREL